MQTSVKKRGRGREGGGKEEGGRRGRRKEEGERKEVGREGRKEVGREERKEVGREGRREGGEEGGEKGERERGGGREGVMREGGVEERREGGNVPTVKKLTHHNPSILTQGQTWLPISTPRSVVYSTQQSISYLFLKLAPLLSRKVHALGFSRTMAR